MRRGATALLLAGLAGLLLVRPPRGVSLGCPGPGRRAVAAQARAAPVVLEGRGRGAASAGAGGLLGRGLFAGARRSGGLRREQLFRGGGPAAPCFRARRHGRSVFFLEPPDEPLLFAPLDAAPARARARASSGSSRDFKRDAGRVLCAHCALGTQEAEHESNRDDGTLTSKLVDHVPPQPWQWRTVTKTWFHRVTCIHSNSSNTAGWPGLMPFLKRALHASQRDKVSAHVSLE